MKFMISEKVLYRCKGDEEEVVIPPGVEVIDGYAFENCNIRKLVLSSDVKQLNTKDDFCRYNAVSNIDCLRTIEVDPGNETFYTDGTCLYEKGTSDKGEKTVTLVAIADVPRIMIAEDVTDVIPLALNARYCLQEIQISPENQALFVKDNGLYKKIIDCEGKSHIFLTGVIDKKCEKFNIIEGTEGIISDPDGICNVFAENTRVKEVVIPDSVTHLGKRMFYGCESLERVSGAGVISLGSDKKNEDFFYGCERLKELNFAALRVIAPDTFKYAKLFHDDGFAIYGNNLFECVSSADPLVIPDGVVSIFANSIPFRVNTLILPDTIRFIDRNAFGYFMPQNINVPKAYFDNISFNSVDPKITFDLLSREEESRDTIEAYAKLFVNIKDKKYVDKCMGKLVPLTEARVQAIIDAISDGNPERDYNKIVKFIVSSKEVVSENMANKIADILERAGAKTAYKQLVEAGLVIGSEKDKELVAKARAIEQKAQEVDAEDAEKLAKGERPDEKEVIQFVEKYWKEHAACSEIWTSYKENKTIHYKNSNIICDIKVLYALFNEYANEFLLRSEIHGEMSTHREIEDGGCIKISEAADYIFKYIEEEELLEVLCKLAHSNNYRFFILAYARFISDERVTQLIDEMQKKAKGSARNKYWAKNVHAALHINDSIEAMRYFDSKKELDSYAKVRGTSAQEIRDLKLIPDFGFGADGVKRYAAGDIKLAVTILPDTSVQLFNETTGKVVKSIPKKGAPEEEIEKIKADFSEFKKESKKFIKTRIENLRALHRDGTAIEFSIWERVYLNNPLIKPLTYSLVWVDDNGVTFIPSEKGLFKVDKTAYSTTSKVRLAHVAELSKGLIKAWQNYLLKKRITQPIEQMHELRVNAENINAEERYIGLRMTVYERDLMRKALEKKGIEVWLETFKDWYEMYAECYGTIHMGDYVSFDYKFDDNNEADKYITIKKGCVKQEPAAARYLNAILCELDKIVVRRAVANDKYSELTAERLSLFTLDQIMTFIDVAAEFDSTKCLAVLLEFKKRNYESIDPFANFKLDWL